MADFPHLQLRNQLSGFYKFRKSPRKPGETTKENLKNRQVHGQNLKNSVDQLFAAWTNNVDQREEGGLPALPDPNVVPIFLQVDPNAFDVEGMKGFGIEIISEEEGGFIIGASSDNFLSLKAKIDIFLSEQTRSKNQAAQLWQINTGTQWRVDQILSDDLKAKWNQID